ncbi:hypothetical protein OE184_24795, partial [Klebsiella pneumoniae]|uniref:hypothetical protein n=3 Tax=Klebsiella pneumoniae TaxID=573 RepID=UPI0021D79CBB
HFNHALWFNSTTNKARCQLSLCGSVLFNVVSKFCHILVNKKYYKSPFQYVSIVTFQATKIGRVLFTVLSEKLSLLQSLTMKLLSRLLWRSSDEPVTKAFLFLGTGFN